MPALPELLKNHKDLKRLSFRDMERMTGISKATIAWLTRSDHELTTSAENVRAIAYGLRIPLREVQLAAIETAGLMPSDWSSSDRVANLADDLEILTEEDYRMVADLTVRLAQDGDRG